MQQSSPISPQSDRNPQSTVMLEKERSPDILVISRTFPPTEGGIQEYVYNRCLQDPDRIAVLSVGCPGDAAFDQTQPFPVHRWFPFSIPQLGPLNSILKQVFSMVGAVVCAIQLYFRYRYRYIEWGHGYDFPAILLLSYVLPIQFFMYLHGDDVLCPMRNPILHRVFEWTLQRAQGIACNSSFTQDYLKQHFTFDTPTYVINPTVRPEKFGAMRNLEQAYSLRSQIRQRYGIPDSAVVILSVGRLVPRKGFDRVIENLPILLADGLDVHFLVCGRGSMMTELQALTSRLNVAERVHFAGFVPDEDLAGYYAACDLFAMITFYDSKAASIEGFGIVYVEAGYFRKPVLAARVGGVVDAVQSEENGILVDPTAPEEITEALRRLCRDGALRDRLGQRGQELALHQTPHRIMYEPEGS